MNPRLFPAILIMIDMKRLFRHELSLFAAAALCMVVGADAEAPQLCRIEGMICRDAGMANIFLPVAKASVYLQTVAEAVFVPLSLVQQGAPPEAAVKEVRDSTRSDGAGSFSFSNLPPGAYTLTVKAEGYRTRALDVTLTADESFLMQLVDKGTFTKVQGTVKAARCFEIPAAGSFPCSPRSLPACTVWAVLPEELPAMVKNNDFAPAPLTALFAVTGANGAYLIDSLPLAYSGQRVIVWTRFEGVDAVSVDTTVVNGAPTIVDFMLQPSTGAVINLDTPRRRTALAGPVSYSERDRLLSVNLERSQIVSIEAFVFNGRRDGRLSAKRAFKAGMYRFSLDNPKLGAGVIIVRVQGEDFSDTRRIVLSEKK